MASPLRTPLLLLAILAVASAANTKQGPRLLGGLQEAKVEEEGVKQALDFAISEYNKGSNDAYHSRALEVVRARKQKTLCSFQIYTVPWQGTQTLTKSSCKSA
ncbi:Cystatin-C [Cricetulus griseus]|uniref:Cystatin-C n=1 Tax=Cricetulus griseus TaxID=10029 RepID=G3H705_CRIGR|nr:Cystatin-C [Cricetulus griseus]